jgi:hypothetical protein
MVGQSPDISAKPGVGEALHLAPQVIRDGVRAAGNHRHTPPPVARTPDYSHDSRIHINRRLLMTGVVPMWTGAILDVLGAAAACGAIIGAVRGWMRQEKVNGSAGGTPSA